MKKKRIWIPVLAVIIFLVFLFLQFGGEILIAKDEIDDDKQAVTVLLMGSIADRAIGAADLYNAGKTERIIMVDSYMPGSEILEERNILIDGDAERSKEILLQSGINPEDVTILPGDAESTKDEAIVIADYVKQHPEINEIILVTSKYHSQRSKIIFNKALKKSDVTVYSAPTPYDPYEGKGWYREREDIQRVLSEYVKLAHYYLLEQFMIKPN